MHDDEEIADRVSRHQKDEELVARRIKAYGNTPTGLRAILRSLFTAIRGQQKEEAPTLVMLEYNTDELLPPTHKQD